MTDKSVALQMKYWAGDEIRTRDPNLGKVVLYQTELLSLVSFQLDRIDDTKVHFYIL